MSGPRRPQPPYGPTLVVGLLGAVAATVGVAKPWVSASTHQAGLPEIEAQVSGSDLAPLAGALGVVVLAAFGAVIATRALVRRALGVLIVVAAAVVLVTAVHPPGATDALHDALTAKGWSGGEMDTTTLGWRWLALGGSILAIAAGVAISLYGSQWATMGSEYDAPRARGRTAGDDGGRDATAAVSTEADAWREIDRGRDPTHDDRA
jgi:uncharacterized membrane protein (TIGR02234 family)